MRRRLVGFRFFFVILWVVWECDDLFEGDGYGMVEGP